jgi:putative ABC transport system permease protein
MSMAVRERRTEIAVLKTLGFSGRLVMGLVLGESLVIGLLGGGLGLALGWASIRGLQHAPVLGSVLAFYPDVGLTAGVASLGLAVAIVLALAAGTAPAVAAYRSKVTEILRQV